MTDWKYEDVAEEWGWDPCGDEVKATAYRIIHDPEYTPTEQDLRLLMGRSYSQPDLFSSAAPGEKAEELEETPVAIYLLSPMAGEASKEEL